MVNYLQSNDIMKEGKRFKTSLTIKDILNKF
jgi:hypothetical protein